MMKKEDMYVSISSQKEWEKLLWADTEWLLATEDFLSWGKSEREKSAISQDNKLQKKKEEKKWSFRCLLYASNSLDSTLPQVTTYMCPFSRKTELGLCR